MSSRSGDVLDDARCASASGQSSKAEPASCDYYRKLFEDAPLPYQSLDREQRLVEVNDSWLELLGCERREAIGRGFADFLAPESRKRFSEHFCSAMENGVISGLEISLLRKDGTVVAARHYGRIVRDESGKVLHSHCMLQDVSDQKAMEEALAVSEARYQMLVEHQNDLLVSFTPEGILTFVSPSYCRTFGRSADTILGTDFTPMIHEGDRTRVRESLATITPESPTTFHEERASTVDGWRWFDWSAKGMFDEQGRLVEIISVGRDCTDRKRMEEALDGLLLELEQRVEKRTAQLEEANDLLRREIAEGGRAAAKLQESERKYRNLNRSMRDGFAAVNMRGAIVEHNEAFRDLLGYEDDEIRTLTYEDITPARWHDFERRIIERQVLVRGYSELYEKEYRIKDGSIVPVELRTHLIRNEENDPVGMWAIVRDISQRKDQEAAMLDARRQAEAASLAKSAFLSKMSHEFRTPLNAIINMSALALDTGLDQEQRDYIQAVADSGKRLLKAVNNVLEYARLEEGSIEFRSADFNLLEVLEAVVRDFQQQAAEKGLFLNLGFAPGLLRHFRGDPDWLYHILASLVDNAVKYTAKGGVRVSVSCGEGLCPLETTEHDAGPLPEDAAKETVLRIEVADSGPGIAKKQLEHIFTPFTQGDDGMARRYGGAGLGLAMAKRIVELMRGALRCESAPGAGSRFIIDLPMQPGSRSAAADYPGKSAESAPSLPIRGKVLNIESALQRFGGDEELYFEISGDFLDGVEEKLAQLREFVEAEDFQALALLAQSLRGNCGTIGAEQCCKVAMDIEESARAEDGGAAAGFVEELAQGLRLAKEAVDAKRAEHRGNGKQGTG